jgi:hypothetical protein
MLSSIHSPFRRSQLVISDYFVLVKIELNHFTRQIASGAAASFAYITYIEEDIDKSV